MPDKTAPEAEKHMVQFKLYLYRKCARAKQEGVIWMLTPENKNEELHFDHLDEIPAKVRDHLKMIGLAYDIADNSDDTAIAPKTRKSKVIQKIRKTAQK